MSTLRLPVLVKIKEVEERREIGRHEKEKVTEQTASRYSERGDEGTKSEGKLSKKKEKTCPTCSNLTTPAHSTW